MKDIIAYTDGSCHTQMKIGAWAAILFIEKQKIILEGHAFNTTHNRMELLAVINVLEYLQTNFPHENKLTVISDSQYVVGLERRKEKLFQNHFKTKAGKEIQNVDLVKKFYAVECPFNLQLQKIKAHQTQDQENYNYNIDVDKLVRSKLRALVNHAL